MNQEIKKLWIDALRSGLYKQGRKQLERDDKFCCVGVLCHIAHKSGIVDREDNGCVTYGNSDYCIPSTVRAWSGFNPENPITYEGGKTNVYALNDTHKLSFNQIADILERQA